jgi:hypothetical protein
LHNIHELFKTISSSLLFLRILRLDDCDFNSEQLGTFLPRLTHEFHAAADSFGAHTVALHQDAGIFEATE